MNANDAFDFDGMRLTDAAKHLGLPLPSAKRWLTDHGYRFGDQNVRRTKLPHVTEAEIRDRAASAPPSAPCFRCGAARGCEHRNYH